MSDKQTDETELEQSKQKQIIRQCLRRIRRDANKKWREIRRVEK